MLDCIFRPEGLGPKDESERVAMAMLSHYYNRRQTSQSAPFHADGKAIWLRSTRIPDNVDRGSIQSVAIIGKYTITLRCFPKLAYCMATVTAQRPSLGVAVIVIRSSTAAPKKWRRDCQFWEQGGVWDAFSVFKEFAELYNFTGTAYLFAAINMPTKYLGPLNETGYEYEETTRALADKQCRGLHFTRAVRGALETGGIKTSSKRKVSRPPPYLICCGGDAFITKENMIQSFFDAAPGCTIVIRETKLQNGINPSLMTKESGVYWGNYSSKELVSHIKKAEMSNNEAAQNLIEYLAAFQAAKDGMKGLNRRRNMGIKS
jgi:hypothetical protein